MSQKMAQSSNFLPEEDDKGTQIRIIQLRIRRNFFSVTIQFVNCNNKQEARK